MILCNLIADFIATLPAIFLILLSIFDSTGAVVRHATG